MMRFPPALSTGQDAALRLDTIERAAKALTPYRLTEFGRKVLAAKTSKSEDRRKAK